MRSFLKKILPPIVIDAYRALRHKAPLPWEYIPGGWQEGMKISRGWNSKSVVDKAVKAIGYDYTVSPRPVSYNQAEHNTMMVFAYSLAMAARGKLRVNMLDFGGGLGHYYYLAVDLLSPRCDIQYTCLETSEFCEQGSVLFGLRSFIDNPSKLVPGYDFTLASGSLHYIEDWRSIAKHLCANTSGYLLINRIPIVENAKSFVVLQRPYAHGYDTEYLGWFLSREEFLSYIKSLGMELVREFLIDETPYVPGAPEQCHYRGFLFRSGIQ